MARTRGRLTAAALARRAAWQRFTALETDAQLATLAAPTRRAQVLPWRGS